MGSVRPHRTARWTRVVAVAAMALLGLGACRDRDDGEAAGEPRAGGTAVVGMRADFGPLNPIVSVDQYTEELNKYVLYTPIVTYDEDLEVRPYLAESWEMLADTGVVFHLRRDVKWHDGQPVTAEDVEFTFDMAKDPASASLIGSVYLPEVESAEVLDPYTIKFLFNRPHAQALEDFWWAPAPKHLLQDVPASEMRNAPFNRNPVGNGPFRFTELRQGDRLVVERNPDFPEGLGGPPPLERVVFRVVPEPATLLTELITGGVDVDIPVVPDQAADIEEAEGLELFAFPGRTVYFVAWNNGREPFTDPDVRRAMTLAINREDIIEALLFGYGRMATSPIPPQSPLHPEGVEPLPFAPEEALEILRAEGWTDSDGDGVLDKGGRPFRFTVLTSDNPLNRSIVEVVQADLRRIGVDAEIRILEFQTLLSQYKGRDYDAVVSTWVLDNFQVAAAPVALLHSRYARVPQSTNRTGFANPRADALLDRAAGTTDPEAARATWREFIDLIQQESPFTFLFWLDELAAKGPRIQGVEMDPRSEMVSIQRWWVAR